jgi:hypothetical protein
MRNNNASFNRAQDTTAVVDASEVKENPAFLIAFRIVLFICYVLQAMIFPNALTVTVPILLLSSRVLLFCSKPTHPEKNFIARIVFEKSYILASCMAVYSAIFYVVYATHQLRDAPYMTSWIHPKHRHNYSFTETRNNLFSGGINDEANVYMRENPFTWPRIHKAPGVRINGTLLHAGPGGKPLPCGDMAECYAANMAVMEGGVVPMPSRFYSVDIMVTPPKGMMCKDLEIYRIVYNSWMGVDHSLDYPASSPPVASSSYKKCNLFGKGDSWCLSFMHTFTGPEYNATIADKCNAEGGVVIFRLPPRTVDVEPQTGRTALDVILVPPNASVGFRYTWHSTEVPTLLTQWSQWEYTKQDAIQEWRDSTGAFAVVIRHVVAVLPLLMLWYFLLVRYEGDAANVQLMCIFVFLPSSIIFFSVGAWLPLTSTILCGITINIVPANVRFQFSMYACALVLNLIQCIAMTVLYSTNGTNAFMYADSFRMVNEDSKLSGYAFVSGSPAWVTLMMPTSFFVNVLFCIGLAQTLLQVFFLKS